MNTFILDSTSIVFKGDSIGVTEYFRKVLFLAAIFIDLLTLIPWPTHFFITSRFCSVVQTFFKKLVLQL